MQSFDTDQNNTIEPSEPGSLLPVCPVDALARGTLHRFILPNSDELVICNIDGEFYAIDNLCPHQGAPLSDGAVFDHVVECNRHGWQFDVRTGNCLTVPERIRTFQVRVVDGVINVVMENQQDLFDL